MKPRCCRDDPVRALLQAGETRFTVSAGGGMVCALEVPVAVDALREAAGATVEVRQLPACDRATACVVKDTAAWLTKFLAGRDPGETPPLDLAGLTPFTAAVLVAAGEIPRGETRSYRWVAGRAGCHGGARAAGGALGRNPLPLLVPCHRVVKADGSLGGFGLGPAYKRWLLDLENIDTSVE